MTTTPNEAAQPQQKQYASTGRLGTVMFIGQLGWAAVGAACGTLLAALAAEVKPEDKVDFLALLTTTGAIAAVICMITAGTLSDRTRSRFGPRNPWIIGGAIVGTLAFAAIGLTRNPALLVIAHMIYQGGLNCMLGAFNAVPRTTSPTPYSARCPPLAARAIFWPRSLVRLSQGRLSPDHPKDSSSQPG